LERAGVKTAYAEYTAAYAISYLSDERIAASEVRHSTVGVRYHPYAEAAAADAVQTYVCASGSAEVAERERVAERSGSLCAETVGGVYTAVTIMPPRTETSAAMRRSS